jgi:hypothetical protein
MNTFDRERAQKKAFDAIRDTEYAAERLITESMGDLWHAFEMMRDVFQSGGRLYVCGNGGSAADAQHFATELVVRLDSHSKRRALPATSLSTDTSILTAAANDLGFDRIPRQVERAPSGDFNPPHLHIREFTSSLRKRRDSEQSDNWAVGSRRRCAEAIGGLRCRRAGG